MKSGTQSSKYSPRCRFDLGVQHGWDGKLIFGLGGCIVRLIWREYLA